MQLPYYTNITPYCTSFWCSNDVSGGQSKIVLRRLQQEWFLSLDIDIYRDGRCKLSNAAAGQPVTRQPRGVYPYRRETVISVCGFSFMASSLTTKFGERDGILEIPEMPSMPGARCNRQCSYMSRQCSSLSPGAVTCKLVSAQAVTGNAAICPGNPVYCDLALSLAS